MARTSKKVRKAVRSSRSRTYPIVVQAWLESERGWGQRPDGYSLHRSEAHRVAFIEDYWRHMPPAVPDEYSRPDGPPHTVNVEASLYAEIKNSKFGIRVERHPTDFEEES